MLRSSSARLSRLSISWTRFMSISSTGGNPLLQREGLPHFSSIVPEHVIPAVESDLTILYKEFNALETKIKSRNWSNTDSSDFRQLLEDLEKISSPLSYSFGIVRHLMSVANSDELRSAYEAVQPQVVAITQKIGQSRQIYDALVSFKNLYEQQKITLNAVEKRILDNRLLVMKHQGVGLSTDERTRFNTLDLELSSLKVQFSNNVLDSTKASSLWCTPEDLHGIPDSRLQQFEKNARVAVDGTTASPEGQYLVHLDGPSYLSVMQYCTNSVTREKFYRAWISRASAGSFDNAPLISKICQNRHEMAHINGYTSHAQKSLATKMAKTVQKVEELDELLHNAAYPAAKAEYEELLKFAASHGHNDRLHLWDLAYWSRLQKESLFDLNLEEVKQYLPYPLVLEGLFHFSKYLFNIDVKEVVGPDKPEVWNEDVSFYNIFDSRTKTHLASFYLDPYSRPGSKRGGAWMDSLWGKSKILKRIPVAYLTCNGTAPQIESNGGTGTPSLMTFDEAKTLFHEFGHGLQHMLTTVEYDDAAGINGIEWDAVELPSQFMENWLYTDRFRYFMRHHKTGEKISEGLFEKLQNAQKFQTGSAMLRQLYFGAMDMYINAKFDPMQKEETVFDVQAKLRPRYTVTPEEADLNDRFLCSFSHIFSGGYSAGYYSYKWAEVMSADAYSAFEELKESGADEEEVRQMGIRFRDTVLSQGGGSSPSDVFESFRGRKPTPNALLRHCGLAK